MHYLLRKLREIIDGNSMGFIRVDIKPWHLVHLGSVGEKYDCLFSDFWIDRDSRFGSWILSIARNLGPAIRCVMISRLGVAHHSPGVFSYRCFVTESILMFLAMSCNYCLYIRQTYPASPETLIQRFYLRFNKTNYDHRNNPRN